MLAVCTTVLTVAALTAGGVAAAMGLYLVVVAAAALFYRPPRLSYVPATRLTVLIPAHDESELIGRCVRSVRAQNYPGELLEVVVIADNCSDDTAQVAAAAGAHRVMVRSAPGARGKGQALRWALDDILAVAEAPDAVVMIDADTVAAPDCLAALARRCEAGSRAVQAEYLLAPDGPRETSLSVVAFMLVNRVRPAGLAALGLPGCQLTGNGMLFSAALLRERPWTAFSSAEDLEYSLGLYESGQRVDYAGEAHVTAPPAPSAHAAAAQQLRWHGGRTRLARRWLPQLARRAVQGRRPSLLIVALGLSIPPLALLVAGVVLGAATTAILALAGLVAGWSLVPWVIATVSIPASVLIGLASAGAPAASYRALVAAPGYVLRMALGVPRVLTFKADTWVRTQRAPGSADEV